MSNQATNGVTEMYTFTVRGKAYKAKTLKEASDIYCSIRDAHDLTSSKLPPADIYQDGQRIGYISYNGRIWEGTPDEWTRLTPMLHEIR